MTSNGDTRLAPEPRDPEASSAVPTPWPPRPEGEVISLGRPIHLTRQWDWYL